jgi:hypothetical protein
MRPDRKTVAELMRDPRYPRFLREYLDGNPAEPERVVQKHARSYALCMCRFPEWHPIFCD